MKKSIFKPSGVSTDKIEITLSEDNTIKEAKFEGDHNESTLSLSTLLAGMNAVDVIERFSATDCCGKGSSFSEQLARALREMI